MVTRWNKCMVDNNKTISSVGSFKSQDLKTEFSVNVEFLLTDPTWSFKAEVL